MACWTASNTRTLIALVVTQLVLTGIITVAIVVMVVYVAEGATKLHTAATHVAGVTESTAKDLQNAAKRLGGGGADLLKVASKTLMGFVSSSEEGADAAKRKKSS